METYTDAEKHREIEQGEKVKTDLNGEDITLSYKITGYDSPPSSDSKRGENVNNYRVSIARKCESGAGAKKTSFMFYGSINDYQKGKEKMTLFDLLWAFECFLEDGRYVKDGFDEFCDELGYDKDSLKAYRTFKACERAEKKADKLNIDAEAIISELREGGIE